MASAQIKICILIPTLEKRKAEFEELHKFLYQQVKGKPVIIKHYRDNGEMSIGHKRNLLLRNANAEYSCFIDDDDWVSENYVELLLKSIESKPDCVSLKGIITTDGDSPEVFEHSIKYDAYRTTNNEIKYERFPNHLNLIKWEIARKVSFPDKYFGEDTDWATKIHELGLIKSEVYVPEILYHYRYKKNK